MKRQTRCLLLRELTASGQLQTQMKYAWLEMSTMKKFNRIVLEIVTRWREQVWVERGRGKDASFLFISTNTKRRQRSDERCFQEVGRASVSFTWAWKERGTDRRLMEQQHTEQRVGRRWPAHARPSELDFIQSAMGNHWRCLHKGAIDSDC